MARKHSKDRVTKGGPGPQVYANMQRLSRARGLSTDGGAMAEYVGIDAGTLSGWRTDQVVPSTPKILTVAKAFGVDYKWLVESHPLEGAEPEKNVGSELEKLEEGPSQGISLFPSIEELGSMAHDPLVQIAYGFACDLARMGLSTHPLVQALTSAYTAVLTDRGGLRHGGPPEAPPGSGQGTY